MPSTDLLTGLSTSNTDSNDDTDEVINSSLEDASSGSSDQLDANGVLSSNSDNTYTVETTTIEPEKLPRLYQLRQIRLQIYRYLR